jgi:amidase
VRVALVPDPSPGGTPASVQGAVRAAAAALADAGYVIEEAEPPGIEQAAAVWLDILKSDMSIAMQVMSPPWGEPQALLVERLFSLAEPTEALRTMGAYVARQALARAWGAFLDGGRVIVAPVYNGVPFPARDSLSDVAGTFGRMSLTTACNVLGFPAVSVTAGMSEGLPVGVQVISSRFREDLCLDPAELIEERSGVLTPIDPR